MRICAACGGTEFDEISYRCVKCPAAKAPDDRAPADCRTPDGRTSGATAASGAAWAGENAAASATLARSIRSPISRAARSAGARRASADRGKTGKAAIGGRHGARLLPGEIILFGGTPFLVLEPRNNWPHFFIDDTPTPRLLTAGINTGVVRMRYRIIAADSAIATSLDPGDSINIPDAGESEMVVKRTTPPAGEYPLLNLTTGTLDAYTPDSPKDLATIEKLVSKQ